MPRRIPIWLLAATTVASLLAPPARAEPGECKDLIAGPSHSVTGVSDGETVTLDNGEEVRLVGALAPRAMDVGAEPGSWPAEIAATAELRALVLGKSVELAFGGDRSDRYGRLQAQVFVRDGTTRHWVQGHLLELGLARAYVLPGNRACAEGLLAAEQVARDAGRGLWRDAAYAIRDPDRQAQLARYRGTFQILEGAIAGVAQVKGAIYLNFGTNWRHSFSVSLRRADRALLGAYAADPKGLKGVRIRVRGWLEPRGAPLAINLSTGGAVEILGQAAAPPANALDERITAPSTENKPPGLIEAGR